jgi:hypothetical protein
MIIETKKIYVTGLNKHEASKTIVTIESKKIVKLALN